MATLPNRVTDEAVLVSKAQAGDQRAFTSLYAAHAPGVFSYCRRLLSDRFLAEEALQKSFVKAFTSLRTLDAPAAFGVWLFSIVRNEVFTIIRSRKRNGSMESLQEDTVWLSDPDIEGIDGRDLSTLVHRALQSLKPEYREILILRHYEELSYAEISAVTGDSVSSIESRLTRARHALAKRLGPLVKE